MNELITLLLKCRKMGITLAPDDSGKHLRVTGNLRNLSEAEKDSLRQRKEEIIGLLKNSRQAEYNPIPTAPPQAHYELSSAQRRLWLLSQWEASNLAYHIPGVYVFEGPLDRDALERAFTDLLTRHEILRTVFGETEDGEVRQSILSVEELGFRIAYRDLRPGLPMVGEIMGMDNCCNLSDMDICCDVKSLVGKMNGGETVDGLIGQEIARPFDLAKGPLIRAALLQVSEQQWIFCYVMHHIIGDGWSMPILFRELLQQYAGHATGIADTLPPLRLQYKDYAAWQQSGLQGGAFGSDKAYWLEQLSGELPVLELSGDRPRPAIKSQAGGSVSRHIDRALAASLRKLCQEQGATLYMGLMAAVNALLYRYTGEEDIIIGSPIAGREHADLEDQVGFYVNTLALRTRFSGENNYKDLLAMTRQVTLEGYAHQQYPFDELVNALEGRLDRSRNALFDVMVALQNMELGQMRDMHQVAGVWIREYQDRVSQTSRLDLSFTFIETGEEIELYLEYNSDIYDRETIGRMSVHLEGILAAIVSSPESPICRLDYLGKAEKRQLFSAFNDTAMEFPMDRTVVSLFEEQVSKTPEKQAVVFDGGSLSYSELNEKANCFGHYLQNRFGVVPKDLVGIRLERGEWLVIAILGVLKAGGAYLPIDPAYPEERINYMIADSGIAALVDEGTMEDFTNEKAFVNEKENPSVVSRPDDPAYVIYTSGSTGKPKGVVVGHRSLVNLCGWHNTRFAVTENDRASVYAGVAFDASVWEMFPYLIKGASLNIVPDAIRLSAAELGDYFEKAKITIGFLPTQIGEQFLETGEMPALRYLLLGGDKMTAFVKKGYEVVNNYGPTENTVVATSCTVGEHNQNIPIGKPIANTRIYILDGHKNIQPIGAVGELYIGGAGLALGYLNRPELTAEKFVTDPYKVGERMYRTGDLGRWLGDGNIEFLGRKDEQVKIRGYRVELAEIESVLQSCPGIESAVVVARPVGASGSTGHQGSGQQELVAYVTGNGREGLQVGDIRSYIGRSLPAYMQPAHFVELGSLPLTPNGKVDRKGLPDPAGLSMGSGHEYIGPRNETEQKLVKIWEELLGKEGIGVKDDFFLLGGHSLHATRLASQLHKEFDVKVAVKDVFARVVLEEQARWIGELSRTAYESIGAAGEQPDYAVSSAQRRIWVLSQWEEGNVAYNMPGVYVLEGALEMGAMEGAFADLLERHEVLRTVFAETEEGEVRQRILSVDELGFQIAYRDLRPEGGEPVDGSAGVEVLVRQEMARPFDLARGPLIRVSVMRVSERKWIFSYVMHHIIGDGWSMSILIDEWQQLYEAHTHGGASANKPSDNLAGLALPSLRLQYKDYATWQQSRLQGGAFEADKQYWLEQLSGELPVLELSGDRPRPAIKSYSGGSVSRRIGGSVVEGLRRLGQEQGATLYMSLLAAVNALLYRYTGQEDMVIGSPIAGREHADLEDQVGFYVNTLALRTRFSGEGNYKDLLAQARQVTLGGYAHQQYPFDELVNALKGQRDRSRNALFDVIVALQNAEVRKGGGPASGTDLSISRYLGIQAKTSRFDLVFNFMESPDAGGLEMVLEYNSDIYDRETIKRMACNVEGMLAAIVWSPDVPLWQLDYLGGAERQQLLSGFNDTAVDYPIDQTIVSLFEEQVMKTPESPAVVFETTSLSYAELNEKANCFGDYLRHRFAIGPDDLVGLQLDRSEWLIIAILGVLKAGGAFLPIDPAYPQARINYMLENSGCKAVVDEGELETFRSGTLQEQSQAIGSREHPDAPSLSITSHGESRSIAPQDLAYVIYTSGSTGKPKGVMIAHSGIVNTIFAQQKIFGVREGERGLQFSSPSFDASVWEIFLMLASGGVLYIANEDCKKSPALLEQYITDYRIDIATLPPAYVKLLQMENIRTMSRLITAGESAIVDKAIEFNHHGIFYNAYGPTESSICASVFAVDKGAGSRTMNIPIGKPIANTRIYILDRHKNIQPIGAVGELYIGGAGLALGYLNRPELTAEKFVTDPYRVGERMYRTGDLGRWLGDGNIEFLGRKDEQVKIRGYRVELAEIESVLQSCPGIESAVVVARPVGVSGSTGHQGPGQQELVAYVTGNGREGLQVGDIRSYIGRSLPAYMQPAHFVELGSLPLTPNGKVDRKGLPDPAGLSMGSGHDYIGPRNETEQKLVKIWEELLGKEGIGVKDDFFLLGGHSLHATRLASQLHKEFDVKVAVKDVFARVVLEEQARWIGELSRTAYESIGAAGEQPDYAVSSAQRRIWVLSQWEEGNVAYNMPGVYVLEGGLDIGAMEGAFADLLERHEVLRTVFAETEEGEVRQRILSVDELGFQIAYRDLRPEGGEPVDGLAGVEVLVRQEMARPFDLARGPLIRVSVMRVSERKWIFSYVMHHIIGDGWSMSILIDEWQQLYEAHTHGGASANKPSDNLAGLALPALRLQYKDYATWQQTRLQGGAFEVDKQYWLEQLSGELPVLELSGDRPRPAIKSYSGGSVSRRIGGSVVEGLRRLGQEQGATLYMSLLAAVNALLYRYTGQEDMVIGSPIAGREHADLEDQVGFYVNTLALRTRFSGEGNYKDLLAQARQVTLGGYAHQQYPFDELVNALKGQRDRSRNALFDVIVALQNAEVRKGGGPASGTDLSISRYLGVQAKTSRFDLSFSFTESPDEGGGMELLLEYNSDIYDRETIDRLGGHMESMLAAIVSSPDIPLWQLDYLGGAERQQLLSGFNDTAVDFPIDQTIVSLFEEQVRKTPDRPAVIFETTSLSYAELNEKARRLSAHLRREYGVLVGDPVGILLDRSEKVIIAILGILHAGGVYVPIDPDYPDARKEWIIQDTGIKLLITQTDYIFDMGFYEGPVFAIDVQLDSLEEAAGSSKEVGSSDAAWASEANSPETAAAPESVITSGDLAYIMYTSGSTGKPKGVMVEHRNVIRLVKPANFVSLTGEEVLLSTGAVSFDATTFEYWSMLLHGGSLVLCRREVLLDGRRLAETILAHHVDTMWFTAGWLNELVDKDIAVFEGLRTILAGGDKLSPAHINALLSQYPDLTIVNGYGPTENTTFSLTYPVPAGSDNIPVGKPINNSTAYILDARHQLCPIGVVGEICVGGSGLARGYLHQPVLTQERFVVNPLIKGERMYKTGDLGKWLPDGNIAFMGRKDDQVKIRGFRVEPGEIECLLQNYPGVDAAVVIARTGKNGDKDLVAYLVSGQPLLAPALKEYVGHALPLYMVPAHFVQLEALPLTLNGKVDKRALPDPEGLEMATGKEYIAPRQEMDEKLAAIWQRILGRDKVGIRDNFFDIGGDSIKVLRIVSEARKTMNLDISVEAFYRHSTIESIVDHLRQDDPSTIADKGRIRENEASAREFLEALKMSVLDTLDPATREDIEDVYPMSDIERGMVYESLVDESLGIYHDQIVVRRVLPGFDKDIFQLAFALLVEKHPILRTSFHLHDFGTEVQIVHKKTAVIIDHEYIDDLSPREQEETVAAFIRSELARPFDVSAAPLWRLKIFYTGGDEIALAMQFHHAILDGWSHASLVTELYHLYGQLKEDPGYRPAKLQSSYKDFIIQHETDKRDEKIRAFWQQELADSKRLDLFTGEAELRRHSRAMDSAGIRKLEEVASSSKVSIKAIALAAYMYMLKILNYDNEIVTGVVTNTRPACEDGDRILGCFLNTCPVRMVVDEQASCRTWISRVQEKLIGLKGNERLSLLEIAQLHSAQAEAGNPFFDCFFNFVDFHVYGSIREAGTAQTEVRTAQFGAGDAHGNTRTNIALDFSIDVTGGGFRMGFTLSKKLRSGFSPERLGELYFKIVQHIIDHPDQALHQVDYLGTEERSNVLSAFASSTQAYPKDQTVVSLFEAQAALTPDDPALVCGDKTYTYKELNESANRLGSFLRSEYNIQPDDLVGIRLGRNEWMVISMLAVLKSGGAYVPVDPEYPKDRIAYMIGDSGCRVLINEEVLTAFGDRQEAYDCENLPLLNSPADLAYVIYTSGSTGQPKGVMITHQALVDYSYGIRAKTNVGDCRSFGLVSTIAADLGNTVIYTSLLMGGVLHVFSEADLISPERMSGANLDCLKIVPSHWKALQGGGKLFAPARCLIFGGEPLTPDTIEMIRLHDGQCKVYNHYGPSETTIGKLVREIDCYDPDLQISLGSPFCNAHVYVIDAAGNPVAIGVTGEICIGGDGLARGYWKKPELTAERFIANPFREGERMYKTGDLGRWLPDGTIAFIGRKDEQVKIRGFRIEPGEIEAALLRHPGIGSAVVMARAAGTGDRQKELVAYLVSKETLHVPDIRAFLATTLPAYMIPSRYIQLEAIPLTLNGKIDRKQLVKMEGSDMDTGVGYVAPRNEIEEKLVAIWNEVLGHDKIGIKDNFFDLGGHSLKAVRTLTKARNEFRINIRMEEMFHNATIECFAEEIARKRWAMDAVKTDTDNLLAEEQLILTI